jgi:high-affinity iron transporter
MSLKSFRPPPRCAALLAVAAVVAAARAATAQTGETAESRARRIAAVVTTAAREYGLGVADGAITSATELAESRQLFAQARVVADGLPSHARAEITPRLDSLVARTTGLEAPESVRAAVAELRAVLASALGIVLDPLPAAPPTLSQGSALYAANCSRCHGSSGAGDGPASAGMEPAPAVLTQRSLATSPLDVFRAVAVGIPGTAMAGYESKLSLEDRWAITTYVTGLRYSDAARRAGREWMITACPDCLLLASNWADLVGVSDDSLRATVATLSGTTPPPVSVAYARTAGAADALGADRTLAVRRAVRRAEVLTDAAVSKADVGDTAAARGLALDAYLAFEAVERDVGARSARRVAEVERAFTEFQSALDRGTPSGVDRGADAVQRALAGVAAKLQLDAAPLVAFGQSLVIVLREGLETILILAALSAFLVRAGAAERRRDLTFGVIGAIIASLATAAVVAMVLRVSHARQEAIEGLTMLLASAVLFAVTSWIVSKVQTQKWQAFVRAQLRAALGSRRALAIAGVAFLAVYREGVETVLFYAALFGTAHGADGVGAVAAGLAVGLLLLVGLYLGMERWGVRIPLRPFFGVTGVLLTVMSISFAGQGVAELQGVGWVPATPVHLPALPALGIFPTLQTLGIQAFVGLGFLGAVTWILWAGRREAGAVLGRVAAKRD